MSARRRTVKLGYPQRREKLGPVREIALSVDGLPPAKNEAKSMLAAGHPYARRVLDLLAAARREVGDIALPLFPTESLGLEVVLQTGEIPPSDPTNYLGGIADVLEEKIRRGALEHLAELSSVALYTNDRQIHEVHYRWERASETRYRVRVWTL